MFHDFKKERVYAVGSKMCPLCLKKALKFDSTASVHLPTIQQKHVSHQPRGLHNLHVNRQTLHEIITNFFFFFPKHNGLLPVTHPAQDVCKRRSPSVLWRCGGDLLYLLLGCIRLSFLFHVIRGFGDALGLHSSDTSFPRVAMTRTGLLTKTGADAVEEEHELSKWIRKKKKEAHLTNVVASRLDRHSWKATFFI